MHIPWVEKYRPKTIDEFCLNDDIKNLVDGSVKSGKIDNILFYGGQGVGKTSLVNYIKKSVDSETLVVNGSINNGIDFVRETIVPFINKGTTNEYKFVDIREFERFSPQAQESLLDEIERVYGYCIFFLTCNNITAVIKEIKSRFTVVQVIPSDASDVAKRVKYILENENIEIKPDDKKPLWNYIKKLYPDVRSIIQNIESLSKNGELEINSNFSLDIFYDIIKSIKQVKQEKDIFKAYSEIADVVNTVGDGVLRNIYAYLYDNLNNMELSSSAYLETVVLINEYEYRSKFSVNEKINIMALMKNILYTKVN